MRLSPHYTGGGGHDRRYLQGSQSWGSYRFLAYAMLFPGAPRREALMGELDSSEMAARGRRGRRGMGFPVHIARSGGPGWAWLCGDAPTETIEWTDGHLVTCKYCDRRDRLVVIDGERE